MRYEKIYALPASLYYQGAPIMITAGGLFRDAENGGVFLRLKIKNISDSELTALKIRVVARDADGKPLSAPAVFRLEKLSAPRDAVAGEDALVRLKSDESVSCTLAVVSASFRDGKKWEGPSEDWKMVPKRTRRLPYGDSYAEGRFLDKFGDTAQFAPNAARTLWYCCCGAVNRQEESACHSCGISRDELLGADEETLRREGLYASACRRIRSGEKEELRKALEELSFLEGDPAADKKAALCEKKLMQAEEGPSVSTSYTVSEKTEPAVPAEKKPPVKKAAAAKPAPKAASKKQFDWDGDEETKAKKKKKSKKNDKRALVIAAASIFCIFLIVCIIFMAIPLFSSEPAEKAAESRSSILSIFSNATPTPSPTPAPTPTPVPTPVPTPTPTPVPTPHYVSSSDPDNYGFVSHVEEDGREVSSYEREIPISFSADASSYAEVPGILCFRSDYTRKNAAYGVADMTEFKFNVYASVSMKSTSKGDKYSSGSGAWSGCGWTGQAMIVQWDDDVRSAMTSLYSWAREKEGLVEVISPAEDGCIYFTDLETGKKTRDTLSFNMPFKGTGSVDPRGWPLLYVGTGDDYNDPDRRARAMVISLIDGQKIYEFGVQDTDSFATREWYAYDSAPVIDAKTDTLIWPGENGILYTIKMNASFDPEAGAVSLDPEAPVKFRYDSNNSYTKIDVADIDHKWLGYEASAACWNGYVYLASNDGLFQCIDLNTMGVKWVADTIDDTNASPVLEVISDTEAYLYVGTSLHFTADKNKQGSTPFFKIDAMTGEIVAEYTLDVWTVSGVSGGIQDSAALGENQLEGYIYVNVARYGKKEAGILVCLDKETLQPVWSQTLKYYSWSSPVLVYNSDGSGYVIQATDGGFIYMYDGLTGKELTHIQPEKPKKSGEKTSSFEASPVVFNNRMVIGSRGSKIYFIELQ